MDKAYDRTPTLRSRELRNNPTAAEQKLWMHLRNRQLGVRFNRQVPLCPFICDFAARSAKLIIEVDGGQHATRSAQDMARTEFVERKGYRLLRFWNNDVLERIEGVMMAIEEALKDRPSPSPSPIAGGENQ